MKRRVADPGLPQDFMFCLIWYCLVVMDTQPPGMFLMLFMTSPSSSQPCWLAGFFHMQTIDRSHTQDPLSICTKEKR